MLREESIAKNLNPREPIVSSFNSHQCLLCTDDRNPFEIETEGHLDFMLKRLMLDHKLPPHLAIYNLIEHLKDQIHSHNSSIVVKIEK